MTDLSRSDELDTLVINRPAVAFALLFFFVLGVVSVWQDIIYGVRGTGWYYAVVFALTLLPFLKRLKARKPA